MFNFVCWPNEQDATEAHVVMGRIKTLPPAHDFIQQIIGAQGCCRPRNASTSLTLYCGIHNSVISASSKGNATLNTQTLLRANTKNGFPIAPVLGFSHSTNIY